MSSIQLTGDKTRVVERVQKRLDEFDRSCKAYEAAQKRLNACAAENVQLSNIPDHEKQYQHLLSEFKKAIDNLKSAAERVKEKTDHHHIHKYFEPRESFLTGTIRRYRDINFAFKEPLKELHAIAKQILDTDYDSQITLAQNASQMRVLEAQTAQEYSLIDQTFPSCSDRLNRENPEEYLRQSTLYQYKLLEKKDAAAALAFGKSWMQSLPKEATWEQIESMSFLMLEASKKIDNSDLTEYRSAVKEWLHEHPLPENPDSASLTPAQATAPEGRRIHILGLLYLNKLDLSPEAFRLYQNCSRLYPDQLAWKAAQACYHTSKGQLSEAEQLLTDLPKDDPSVSKAQTYLAETRLACKVDQVYERISNQQLREADEWIAELPQDDPSVIQVRIALDARRNLNQKVDQAYARIFLGQWLEAEQQLAELPQDDSLVIEAKKRFANVLSARILGSGFDLGTLAFFRWVPSSFRETFTFDAAQTGIQLLSYVPARKIWTALLLRTSQPPFEVPLRTGLMMVGDVVDCVFRNIGPLKRFQNIENLTSSSLRSINTAWTLYSNPEQNSAFSYINLGSSVISTLQTVDEMRGVHRSAPTQALFSTLQKIASDVFAASTIRSQADLLPLFRARTHSFARRTGLNTLAALTVSAAPQETEESSKEEWLLAAIGIGSIAAYRFCYDYPYLWAASVMKEAEWCFSQGKYDKVKQTLIESGNSYWVSRARPAVGAYANYVTWLIDNLSFLENPAAYEEFLKRLNFALVTLHESSYYKNVRNHLLLKKAEVAIRKQNAAMLSEVVKERPADQIIKHSFNYLLSHAFHLALVDAAQALTFLKVMGPSFPSRLNPITGSLHQLIQDQTTALQDWSALSSLSLMLNPPSSKKVDQWNDAFQKLQSFFSKNIGKTGIYQELQFYKLMISFAQGEDTGHPEALFKQSNVEVHERFSQLLILGTRLLRNAGAPKKAIDLLKRVKFDSYKDNELIQNYGCFFSSLYSPPLQGDAALEQIQALEKVLAGFKEKHEEQRLFFTACRIVLYLDGGEPAKAKDLLEKADSKVSTETAALLFERMYVSMQESGEEKAVSHLKRIAALGPWQHQDLFQAFQAYLLSKQSSPEIHLSHITAVIALLNGIEQLSNFAYTLQPERHLPEFRLRLSEEKLQEAKDVLNREMPDEFYDQLCKFLFVHLINQGEQLRQTTTLRNAKETLQRLKEFFSARDGGKIHSYVNFLIVLENLQESREITAHQEAYQSLRTVFSQLESMRCSIPASLQQEMIDILSKIALLARTAVQLRTALEAYELIKYLGVQDAHLDHSIQSLREQLATR